MSYIEKIVLPQLINSVKLNKEHPVNYLPTGLVNPGKKKTVYVGLTDSEFFDLFCETRFEKIYGAGYSSLHYKIPKLGHHVFGNDSHFPSVYRIMPNVFILNYMTAIGSNYHFRSVLVINEEYTKIENKIITSVDRLVSFYSEFLDERQKRERDTDLKLFDRVFLRDNLKCEILNDFQNFLSSKDQYKELQLPWKRGYIFAGPPGNGKTLMLRTLRDAFKLDFVNLTSLINSRTKKLELDSEDCEGFYPTSLLDIEKLAKQRIEIDVPTIYYLEDMDKEVGRMSDDDFSQIKLTNLLNSIDGVEKIKDGFILIATTNFLDDLVEAVVGRPGRFDRVWEFKKPELKQIKKFFSYYSFIVRDEHGKIKTDTIMDELLGYSMAFVEEFIKSAKMVTKSNEISLTAAQKIMNKINDHNRIYNQMSEKIGF